MTTLTMVGELQPNQTTELQFDLDAPQLWGAYDMHHLHVGRVALRSKAPDALHRLAEADVVIHARALSVHDSELLYWKHPVNLHAKLRNDMIQPFLDMDLTIPAMQGHVKPEQVHYWHVTVEFPDLELMPGETATVALTPLN